MDKIEIDSINKIISYDYIDKITIEKPEIKLYNEINFPLKNDYINLLSKTFFPAHIPYVECYYDELIELKIIIYSQIKLSEFPLKSLENIFSILDKYAEIFIDKHKFSFKSEQTRLDFNSKKIILDESLLRKINLKYIDNKTTYLEIYKSVRDNLLGTANDIKTHIHRNKRNELYRNYNRDNATLKSLINLYQKEFELSELLYDKISEQDYIKIYYLSFIESEFERADYNSKKIELGRMKEYLNNRLIELEKIPKTDTASKNKIETKAITPIKLELNQTQIVYLFETLIAEKLINTNVNDKLWHLVSQYFIDKDNKPLNNIHKTKSNLKNVGKGKPKQNADLIEKIVSKTKTKKS